MRKVSPLGFAIVKVLALLFLAEVLLFGAGKLLVRRTPIIAPPDKIGDWVLSPGDPPYSDGERDNPTQLSVMYTNGDDPPIHVDISLAQSIDAMRAPQKYMVDSDGRISPYEVALLSHRQKRAYIMSLIQGIDYTVVEAHWCQRPGGAPVPVATDAAADALKSIALRKPFYVCDIWVELHASTKGDEVKAQMQGFADTVADRITNAQ